MRDLYIILGVVVAAILIGTGLFFFGPASLQSDVLTTLSPGTTNKPVSVSYGTVADGINAAAITSRTNYRITSSDDFATLWNLVYTSPESPRVPAIDFTKYEVLALFDGSHSTTGYSIQAASVEDQNANRMVVIEHLTPGPNCSIRTSVNSPFIMIQVPKTPFTLSHEDVVSTTTCQ